MVAAETSSWTRQKSPERFILHAPLGSGHGQPTDRTTTSIPVTLNLIIGAIRCDDLFTHSSCTFLDQALTPSGPTGFVKTTKVDGALGPIRLACVCDRDATNLSKAEVVKLLPFPAV